MRSRRVVYPHVATPETVVDEMLQLVAIAENLSPFETIALGESGKEIDVENPSDINTLNRDFRVPPPLRRSTRQAGYDPDFLEPKKFKPSSYTTNLIDPDFSSKDDSHDEDYELVARPKPAFAGKNTSTFFVADRSPTGEETKTGTGTCEDTEEDKKSLEEVLVQLKKQKASKESTSKEEDPDEEMLQKFLENRPSSSESYSSESDSEAEDIDLGGSDIDDRVSDVEPDVDNTEDNINLEDYDLGSTHSTPLSLTHSLARVMKKRVTTVLALIWSTLTFTVGLINVLQNHHKKLVDVNLTLFYYVLQKLQSKTGPFQATLLWSHIPKRLCCLPLGHGDHSTLESWCLKRCFNLLGEHQKQQKFIFSI